MGRDVTLEHLHGMQQELTLMAGTPGCRKALAASSTMQRDEYKQATRR